MCPCVSSNTALLDWPIILDLRCLCWGWGAITSFIWIIFSLSAYQPTAWYAVHVWMHVCMDVNSYAHQSFIHLRLLTMWNTSCSIHGWLSQMSRWVLTNQNGSLGKLTSQYSGFSQAITPHWAYIQWMPDASFINTTVENACIFANDRIPCYQPNTIVHYYCVWILIDVWYRSTCTVEAMHRYQS